MFLLAEFINCFQKLVVNYYSSTLHCYIINETTVIFLTSNNSMLITIKNNVFTIKLFHY